MGGIHGNAGHRADLHALGLIEMAHALRALAVLDLVVLLAHGDRIVRALGLADIAVDAFVGDHQSHGRSLASASHAPGRAGPCAPNGPCSKVASVMPPDRKSTRLNSSHLVISYAVFCLQT